MASAISKMRKSAQKHRDDNPGHEVSEHDKTVPGPIDVTEAWWHCHTCVDNAKVRETSGWED